VRGKDDSVAEIRASISWSATVRIHRLGRELGTVRNILADGHGASRYYTSDRHDEAWIDSHLDIRDPKGDVVRATGWIFPLGDGRVNVGVGLLSTGGAWKAVTPPNSRSTSSHKPPTRGDSTTRRAVDRRPRPPPMGLALGPRMVPIRSRS